MSLNTLQTYGDDVQHRQLIADTVNKMMTGRANNASSLTLTANAATTTVTDPAFESSMVPVLMATTANAAVATANVYVSSRVKGSFVLTHTNNAQTDRTFLYTRQG